jgi:hypothetical protein
MRKFLLFVICVLTSPTLSLCNAVAQQAPAPGLAAAVAKPEAPPTKEGLEVLAFEHDMEAAVVRGDVAYVDKVSAPDLRFTHGDAWTTGGKPLLVDDRATFLKRVANKQYSARDLDSVKVEMHGDIAITYGRYVAHNNTGPEDRRCFSVWFERVYAKHNGQWYYVSHRTVHGPTYGPDRDSVKDK